MLDTLDSTALISRPPPLGLASVRMWPPSQFSSVPESTTRLAECANEESTFVRRIVPRFANPREAVSTALPVSLVPSSPISMTEPPPVTSVSVNAFPPRTRSSAALSIGESIELPLPNDDSRRVTTPWFDEARGPSDPAPRQL